LARVEGYVAFALGVKEAVGGGEQFDVSGLDLGFGSEVEGGKDLVEGVADMLEFVVQIVAVVLVPVLEAFQEVGWKEGAVAGGVPMGADGLETFGNKSVVALRGTSQPTGIEPAGGPGERIQEHTPVTEEVGLGLVGIKVEPDDFE
jgi:hypothetical protein